MKIDELIKELKYTVLHLPWSEIRKGADEVVARVEAALKAQQGRIDQLEAELREERRWIPVGERLPERFQPVLVCREKDPGEKLVEQGHRDQGDWWKVYGTRTKKVECWMPLPEPPEVDG